MSADRKSCATTDDRTLQVQLTHAPLPIRTGGSTEIDGDAPGDIMTRAVVEGDASLGNEVNCVADLVFEARHQMRGLESTWHADALERDIEAAADVQPRCRTPAGKDCQINPVVGRRRIASPVRRWRPPATDTSSGARLT